MNTKLIEYKIRVEYSYDEKDLPNFSNIMLEILKSYLKNSLEFMRKESSLDTCEVTANWVEVE